MREGTHVEMWKCHTIGQQLPIPDEESQIFWEGCRRQRLLIQQCDKCGTFRFPPRPLCPVCLESLTTWQEDPGQGEVVTFCVYHAEIAGPAWRTHLPYTVVVVQLWYSGVYMLSHLICDDPQLLRIGLQVCVGFEAVHAEIALPKFFPRERAAASPGLSRALEGQAPEENWDAGLLDKDLGAQYINCEFRQGQSL